LPPLCIQKKISSILNSIDDKIELNRQINPNPRNPCTNHIQKLVCGFLTPVKAKIAAIKAGENTESITSAAMRAISGKTIMN